MGRGVGSNQKEWKESSIYPGAFNAMVVNLRRGQIRGNAERCAGLMEEACR
jgi:hypothetical protein